MVHAHGRGRRRVHQPGEKPAKTLRQIALDAIEHTSFYPRTASPPARHDRRAARLVHLAPAQLGVPIPFFLHKDSGELHPRTMEIMDQAADIVEKAASRPGAA